MKAKVGIDDIAFGLGYRLDKKAGVGRYIELVLGDPNNPSDKIIVRNTPDKSKQFFFRRDGSKGDVISFIRENLHSFAVDGTHEWTKIGNVLAQYANQPELQVSDKSYVNSQHANTSQRFEPERYLVYTINPDRIPYLLTKRGFSSDCINDFKGCVLLLKDTRNAKFDGYNIAFPYTNPLNQALSGYEIRGSNGFKSKAAGTDAAHSAWIAEFPQNNPQEVKNVFFFESSFDAMAFYQINKPRLIHSPFALVSVGGSFNPKLVENVMSRFPVAKAWDCFDNDLAGQIYSSNLIKAVDKKDFSIETNENNVKVKFGDNEIQSSKDKFDFRSSAASLGMSYSCGHWKSPNNFKDWNDCLIGKQINKQVSPSKYLRDENLAERRKESIKR